MIMWRFLWEHVYITLMEGVSGVKGKAVTFHLSVTWEAFSFISKEREKPRDEYSSWVITRASLFHTVPITLATNNIIIRRSTVKRSTVCWIRVKWDGKRASCFIWSLFWPSTQCLTTNTSMSSADTLIGHLMRKIWTEQDFREIKFTLKSCSCVPGVSLGTAGSFRVGATPLLLGLHHFILSLVILYNEICQALRNSLANILVFVATLTVNTPKEQSFSLQ